MIEAKNNCACNGGQDATCDGSQKEDMVARVAERTVARKVQVREKPVSPKSGDQKPPKAQEAYLPTE